MARSKLLRCPNCKLRLNLYHGYYYCPQCSFSVTCIGADPRRGLARLKALKNRVNLGTIGLQGGIYQGFTTIDVKAVEDAALKYGVAQSLLDNIASNSSGLEVRDILDDDSEVL